MSAKVKTIINQDRVRQRIAELERQRDQFLASAQQQLAAVNAAIGELRALLEDEEEEGE